MFHHLQQDLTSGVRRVGLLTVLLASVGLSACGDNADDPMKISGALNPQAKKASIATLLTTETANFTVDQQNVQYTATKTQSAESANDLYKVVLEYLCYDGDVGDTFYLTFEVDRGSGFEEVASDIPIGWQYTGCDFPSVPGHTEEFFFADGMGANSRIRVLIDDPDHIIQDVLYAFGESHVEWTP